MYFGLAHITVFQLHHGNTLELPPSTRTVLFSEAHNIANVASNRANFHILYSSYNLEMHFVFLWQSFTGSIPPNANHLPLVGTTIIIK